MPRLFKNKHEIIGNSIKVVGAGDGLSDALTVSPIDLEQGDRLLLVMDVEVDDVSYPRDKKDRSAVVEKYKLVALDVALVTAASDKKAVKGLLVANRDRVQRALASMAGQGTMDPETGKVKTAGEKNGRARGRRGGGPKQVGDGVREAAGVK